MHGERAMDVQKQVSKSPRQLDAPNAVTVRPLLLKPQWLNGLSERLMVSHYVNNYGGALRRLNAIQARLAALDWTRAPAFEINGLKREELVAAGSVILHEIYFGAKATAYVEQVMANLNWERIGARYRVALGAPAEDPVFLPYGAPAQEEARISAEELIAALEANDARRPVLVDLCLPRDLPR